MPKRGRPRKKLMAQLNDSATTLTTADPTVPTITAPDTAVSMAGRGVKKSEKASSEAILQAKKLDADRLTIARQELKNSRAEFSLSVDKDRFTWVRVAVCSYDCCVGECVRSCAAMLTLHVHIYLADHA